MSQSRYETSTRPSVLAVVAGESQEAPAKKKGDERHVAPSSRGAFSSAGGRRAGPVQIIEYGAGHPAVAGQLPRHQIVRIFDRVETPRLIYWPKKSITLSIKFIVIHGIGLAAIHQQQHHNRASECNLHIDIRATSRHTASMIFVKNLTMSEVRSPFHQETALEFHQGNGVLRVEHRWDGSNIF